MGNRKQPFGYQMVMGEIVPHPAEAELVRHKSSLIQRISSAMELELAPVPGESMSLADIERRLKQLNDRTHELLVEAAAAGDPDLNSDLLREVMNEAAALKEQRARITEQRQTNAQAVRRMEDAVAAMELLPIWRSSSTNQQFRAILNPEMNNREQIRSAAVNMKRSNNPL